MRKKTLILMLVLMLISSFAACKKTNHNEGPTQPGNSMFKPIALDTNPPCPMLYYIPFEVGTAGVGLIVNEKWETIAQLSSDEWCSYIYTREVKPGTNDYTRFLCIYKVLGEDYSTKITVYDMSGNRVSALSDFGDIGYEVVENHIVVGEWGKQGIYDLKNGKLSLGLQYGSVHLLGPNVAFAYNNERSYLMDFNGKMICDDAELQTATYVDGVLFVGTRSGAGIMSLSGQWIVPPAYKFDSYNTTTPSYFCDGYVAAVRMEDDKLVFMNRNGLVEESASGEIPTGYFSCETYEDFFVIYGDNPKVIYKNRTATQPLEEDYHIAYADGFYFIHNWQEVSLFAPAKSLDFCETYVDSVHIVYRGSDTYAIFSYSAGLTTNAVFKIEDGKLIEMKDSMLGNLTQDQRFFVMNTGTAIGLVDDDNHWVFKTYRFYYLDDAYAEGKWLWD